MRIAVPLALILSTLACRGQQIALRERSNAVDKLSIFEPVSTSDSDGIMAIRAHGSYAWNIAPLIGVKWEGEKKSLLMAIEVVGNNLTPSTAVLVIDGKTFVVQSADWKVDSRGNLVAFIEKEGLVRNLAKADVASVTVFAPAPVTATFHSSDLAAFRSVVSEYDDDLVHLAKGEAISPAKQMLVPFTEKKSRMKVTVIAQQPGTTPYRWQVDGRAGVACSGDSCQGYYTLPKQGTQQIQGARLRLLRPDSSIVIAECVAKVNHTATLMAALDAVSANDPNSPTFYRDCRIPTPDTVADATFHRNSVKLTWRFDGDRHSESETYSIIGVLEPVTNQ